MVYMGGGISVKEGLRLVPCWASWEVVMAVGEKCWCWVVMVIDATMVVQPLWVGG
jgi:hypothetical protein